DTLGREPLDRASIELVVGLDAKVLRATIERERASIPSYNLPQSRFGSEVGDQAVGREDLEPRRARRDEHGERVRRARVLFAEGDGRLVAVMAVCDQQRRVELDLLSREPPDPRSHSALLDVQLGLSAGGPDRRV